MFSSGVLTPEVPHYFRKLFSLCEVSIVGKKSTQAEQPAEKVTIFNPRNLAREFLALRDCWAAILDRLNASILTAFPVLAERSRLL
ncbi:MAG: hypothetical protein LAO19_22615 [Acidobacteriia bacterium]|nr:hypothetical protein [Terriglobia bacterium]